MHALGFHLLVVTPKVIGLQKQENSSTGLIPYRLLLLWADRLRQQEICSVTVRRRNLHPAFASAEMRILDQIKAELLSIERDGLVVIVDKQRDIADALLNDLRESGNPTLLTLTRPHRRSPSATIEYHPKMKLLGWQFA